MTIDEQSLSELFADGGLEERLAGELAEICMRPTGMSSAGYPYLQRRAWEKFRDRVPHLFRRGLEVYRAVEYIRDEMSRRGDDESADNVLKACRVARQVLFTATITAPPDLWLMRHVLGAFDELGLTRRLLEGDAIYPRSCTAVVDGKSVKLDAAELERDLHFLLSRGMVEQYDDSFRIAGHPRVHEIFDRVGPVSPEVPVPMAPAWQRLFDDESFKTGDRRAILSMTDDVSGSEPARQNHWIPTVEELELGYRILPVVLGLRRCDVTEGLERGASVVPEVWSERYPRLARRAMQLLETAGWLEESDGEIRVTAIGARGFSRGPGPFGIIEAYASYMNHARELLLGGGDDVWVDRRTNVGASQDANPKTFRQANDSLDRFCEETGFEYDVFIEHAMGRGEATRQRWERSGDDGIQYFGADLERAAIEAAKEERRRGRLPPEMTLIPDADIGEPEALLEALDREGADPHGAVMVVGNGFHEIRKDDKGVCEVFQRYHDAGILLLFTEANALLIDDLRATAWNTYHAGFMLVHEKSGQNLRPATPRKAPRLGRPLTMAWNECARRAGYVRLEEYCGRSRTIYPHTPDDGHNPSISVNHFFVPASIAGELD